ncbi:hypothetical protein SI65_05703 [Aspergillus cristatus]|uniref:Myb-like domain-containing protein n=1 Tax=Aspergillus cristatus TaxID=573508 RepID=A0A1E3BFC0_ASPCR|nr:hypothetical protein SI65_05703 [Aspergillus cristatus]
MANDREHLCLSQRPQDSSFASTDGAQEVFGRGILCIQPHGPRNAYIITFLPDVVPPASTPSTSEMPSEKSSDWSDHGPENLARAEVAGNMPGIQNDIPIDPLILADNGPWEAGDLHQPSPQSDSPTVSEMLCPYPDPPPVFCDAPDQQDSITQSRDGNPRSISPPHTKGHQQSPRSYLSTEAGISSSESPLDTSHGDKRSKSRKRKPHQSHEQSSKRVRGLSTSIAGEDSFSMLRSHFLSLPLDERLQFLPWLLEGALPCHIPRSDPMKSRNRDVRSASRFTHPPDYSEPHGSSRKGMPWSREEVDLLLKLRRDERRPWSAVTRLFSKRFPGRSQGSIQVYWSTTLKNLAD